MRHRKLSAFATQSLANADARAERLLGWVRMAVAIVLAVAIIGSTLASNRPDDAVLERRLYFAAVGMICYFLVGLAVVLFVREGRRTGWVAWPTALADVGLISWNVFGVAYFSGISSLYALAFPSSLMIPIVLCFGALRYRPDVQIVTTVLVAVLTALIVFSAPELSTDPDLLWSQMEVTFAAPPNVIRILMLLGVGLIIAVAVYRAKALLERTVTEAEEKANLSRFLPAALAQDMGDIELQALRQGRRRILGLVFVDLRRFTQSTEGSDPIDVAKRLTTFRSQIIDIVEQHGGIVDKFIGDGALLIFGLNTETSVVAETTLKAVMDLSDQFADTHNTVGIGAHLGEVFVGAVGDDRRLEFTVLGAEVNLASRIEKMTKTLARPTLASDAILQAAPQRDTWSKLGAFEIDGVSRPVTLWTLSH